MTDFQQNKTSGSWSLNTRFNPKNWKIVDPVIMPKPSIFRQAFFDGNTEGSVTCTYQGTDPNNSNETSSMWVRVQYQPTVIKPCNNKWSKENNQCIPTSTLTGNVSECTFHKK